MTAGPTAIDRANGTSSIAEPIVNGFYCGSADSPVVCVPCRPDHPYYEPSCPYSPFYSGAGGMMYTLIDNHASGGERCRLYVDGIGLYNWIYIDAGSNAWHAIGTVPANTLFNVRCQARAASPSDAGIGGFVDN